METDYGKRIYQGVRVKHTVKDLLAEKRSRQTGSSRFNGSVTTSQPSLVPLQGSPAVSTYYGVRRSVMADMGLQNSKQMPGDVYPSPLIAKPFAYETPTVQGYPSLLDSYFIDQYGDHRATSIASGATSLFSTSALSSGLPSHPTDSTHFFTRDSWEQALPDSLGPSDLCPDSMQASSSAGCLSSPDSGSSFQYRNSSWNSPASGSQAYTLQALEDAHFAAGHSTTSCYPFPSFMAVSNELTPKMLPASSEESSDTTSLGDNNNSLWPKEDGSPLWGSYEYRRTY